MKEKIKSKKLSDYANNKYPEHIWVIHISDPLLSNPLSDQYGTLGVKSKYSVKKGIWHQIFKDDSMKDLKKMIDDLYESMKSDPEEIIKEGENIPPHKLCQLGRG